MRIAVISDTHNNEKAIDMSRKYIEDSNILIFLGDGEEDIEEIRQWYKGKVYAVAGNCDISRANPSEQILEVEGKRIFICHGHRYNVKFGYNNIYYRGKELEVNIVLFGHSHLAMIEKVNDIILMNPGSISHGIGKNKHSIGYIEICENSVNDMYIEEIEMM